MTTLTQSSPRSPNRMNAGKLARAIYLDMYRNHLVPGDQIDTERYLAQRHGVARGTVRAALNILIRKGVLSRHQGRGTYLEMVLQAPRSEFANLTSPMQLMEVREAMEPALVKIAVQNASVHDLEKIQDALDDLKQQSTAAGFSAADERFHFLIAEACGNPLMIWVYQQINDIRHHDMWRKSRSMVLDDDTIMEYNRQHTQLVEAIFNRNVADAMAAVNEHLVKARADLMRD